MRSLEDEGKQLMFDEIKNWEVVERYRERNAKVKVRRWVCEEAGCLLGLEVGEVPAPLVGEGDLVVFRDSKKLHGQHDWGLRGQAVAWE